MVPPRSRRTSAASPALRLARGFFFVVLGLTALFRGCAAVRDSAEDRNRTQQEAERALMQEHRVMQCVQDMAWSVDNVARDYTGVSVRFGSSWATEALVIHSARLAGVSASEVDLKIKLFCRSQ
jgi:hypothetical protein